MEENRGPNSGVFEAFVDNESACLETSLGRMVRDLMDRIGDKWSLLIISILCRGPLRFSELQRRIPGISQRMLTLKLRSLERDGLLSRTVYAEVPPRVVYDLTALGKTLIEPAQNLAFWAMKYEPAISRAREAFDQNSEATASALRDVRKKGKNPKASIN